MKFTSLLKAASSLLLLSGMEHCAASPAGEIEERQQGAAKKSHYTIGILVYQGFEPLDVFGPLELFFSASWYKNFSLAIIGEKPGPVGSRPGNHFMGPDFVKFDHVPNPQIIATHSYKSHPKLDILLVPGGMGQMYLEQNGNTDIEDFVRKNYKKVDYLLSVCSGALTLAKAGALNGKRATTNKSLWAWASGAGKNVKWVPQARWVVDGNVWTSSGVSAGIDMTHAFLTYLYGATFANAITNGAEYTPHTKSEYDPFAVVYQVPGANLNASLVDCIAPAGY